MLINLKNFENFNYANRIEFLCKIDIQVNLKKLVILGLALYDWVAGDSNFIY